MIVSIVTVEAKPSHVNHLVHACLRKARASLREPGVLGFDVVRDLTNRNRVILIETYKSDEAITAHRTTSHYRKWNSEMTALLSSPRRKIQCEGLLRSKKNAAALMNYEQVPGERANRNGRSRGT